MMAEVPATTVDVRDMVCAQALAVVAKALARLPGGATATLLYDADDVRRDLLVWAAGRGYAAAEVPGALQVTKQR